MNTIGEFGFLERIRRKLPVFQHVIKGAGDDAAVLAVRPNEFQFATTDVLVEHVDFSFRSARAFEVGRKALAVSLSDIAAMGGIPTAAVIGLVIPRHAKLKMVNGFYDGFCRLAGQFSVSIAGGDLSAGPCWMTAVTVWGVSRKKRFVCRSGAKAGDWIGVTGRLGGSISRKHLHFIPRIREGQFLACRGAHAMIDISDGLVQDLSHILKASKTGADLWLDQIPVSKSAFRLAKGSTKRAMIRALTDGEDFELLFTIAPAKWQQLERIWKRRFSIPLSVIGAVSKKSGAMRYWSGGQEVHLGNLKAGYSHF